VKRSAGCVLAALGVLVGSTLAPQAQASTPRSVPAVTTSTSPLFAGYAVSRTAAAPVRTAAARFVVPRISCQTNDGGVGPAVIVGNTHVFSGAGIAVGCHQQVASYRVIVSRNSRQQQSFAVAAGDAITIAVTVTVAKTTISVHDTSSAVARSVTAKGRVMTYAEIGLQTLVRGTVSLGIDKFSPVTFTRSLINGQSLVHAYAYAVERVRGKTVQIAVSKLRHGNSFLARFTHS
jgi:Peptidase A4 family